MAREDRGPSYHSFLSFMAHTLYTGVTKMSFTKSYKTSMKKLNNKKLPHNRLFLVGAVTETSYREGQAPHSTGSNILTAKGNEEIICKVEPRTTMGELTFDPSLYKSVRIVAGTAAHPHARNEEKPLASYRTSTL